MPRLPQNGDVIAGKYELKRLVGQGGMGVVFEAVHLRLNQRVAIKILLPELAAHEEVFARFEREARAAARLSSAHVARVIDVDVMSDGLPYMVNEFLEGCDLDAELAGGEMPVEEAVEVILQVAEAMVEAHTAGIVHRDLKPSNLFVCRVDGRRVMKVLDFGISKLDEEHQGGKAKARLTLKEACYGTPHYAAPEQLRGARDADARSDVWSLGVVLYELLTKHTPFEGPTPAAVVGQVLTEPVPPLERHRTGLPQGLERVVRHALEKDPARRFQTMRDFSWALEPFSPERATTAMKPSQAPPGRARLGEILVQDGLLTKDQLARALEEQQRSGKQLGRVLLEMNLIPRADLLTALAKQQGVIVTADQETEQAPAAPLTSKRSPVSQTSKSSEDEPAEARAVEVPGLERRWLGFAAVAAVAGAALAVVGTLIVTRSSGATAAAPPSAFAAPPSATAAALVLPPPSAAALVVPPPSAPPPLPPAPPPLEPLPPVDLSPASTGTTRAVAAAGVAPANPHPSSHAAPTARPPSPPVAATGARATRAKAFDPDAP